MTTNDDNAYGPVPATEPLALKLNEGLGPLPEAAQTSFVTDSVMRRHEVRSYTAEQMRAYAAQAVETMRAAFRDLNSANDKLLDENFALAAGQCANVTGDDGGTPQCAEIARLKGEVMRLHSELAKLRHD